MHICIISNGYPAPGRPEYPFVEQLCIAMARQGHCITVIAPQSITKSIIRKLPSIPYKRKFDYGVGTVIVYAPKYLSFGKFGLKFSFIKNAFRNAVTKSIIDNRICPDVFYGHFWHMAFAVFPYAKKVDIPLFVATGEAEIEQTVITNEEKEFSKYVKGVICVSSKNKNESFSKNLLIENTAYEIIPNAIDNDLFKITDRGACRKKLGIKDGDFVIVFVGSFIKRKGPDRVSEAINILHDSNIKSIFIGGNKDGKSILPTCNGIIHCGLVKHEEIPVYLNAADVFVLPTQFEGCCNAIVEAMACGLPIISSDLEFNYDILDKSNAILIDPNNIKEIAGAIKKLRDDIKLRRSMSRSSLEKARFLSIDKRVSRIISFIEKNI